MTDTKTIFNIYCDESCHLEHDDSQVMVLGSIWCPQYRKREIFNRIKDYKRKWKLPPGFEVKWHKVSPALVNFYLELIDYFFDDDDLHFRGLVVPDKRKLDHLAFQQTHDDFYFKMYFDLLKVILEPHCAYEIYLDIKDTRSQSKIEKLHNVLTNSHYDFSKQIVRRIQQVRSQEVELIQIADLLIGALSYCHRDIRQSTAKQALVSRIQERSGYSLQRTTLYKEDKMNIFIWSPRNLPRT